MALRLMLIGTGGVGGRGRRVLLRNELRMAVDLQHPFGKGLFLR